MSKIVARGPGEGEILEAGPTATSIKVRGNESGGRLSAVEMRINGGWSGPPAHVHREVDHFWYVIAGEVELTLGSAQDVYAEGSCAFVPAGVSHSFGVPGAEDAILLQVDTPRTLDGYFSDLAKAFPAGSEVDPAVVGEIMQRHDTYPS